MKDLKINELKEDFNKIKAELDVFSKNKNEISNILNDYFIGNTYNANKNRLYEDNKDLFKIDLSCNHEECENNENKLEISNDKEGKSDKILKYCESEIEENIEDNNDFINIEEKSISEHKNDDILNSLDIDVKKSLSQFLTFGLDDEKLNKIFYNKFDEKFDFIKLFSKENNNQLILSLLDIIKKLTNSKSDKKPVKFIKETNLLSNNFNKKLKTSPNFFDKPNRTPNKLISTAKDNKLSKSKPNFFKNQLHNSQNKLNLKESIYSINYKKNTTKKSSFINNLNNKLKKSMYNSQSNLIDKFKDINLVKNQNTHKSKRIFPEKIKFLWHANNLK